MKKFYFLVFVLLVTNIGYTQNQLQITDGEYSFQNLRLEISNYNSKTIIIEETFADTLSLSKLEELPFPLQPIFLKATIRNGILSSCFLWNTRKYYNIENGELIISPSKSEIETSIVSAPSIDEHLAENNYHLHPLLTITPNGTDLELTIMEQYGNSMYNFPLEAKLVLTLRRNNQATL